MIFKRSSSVLFLDPNSTEALPYSKGERVDIILSPALYWVKKIKLPITNLREVKKLLPSLFEESLPEGIYSYSLYKKEDEFIAFAYEDKKILALLSEKGISLSDINSIHFAQSEFEELESALKVSETQGMCLKDSLVVLAPLSWMKSYESLNTKDLKLSKHTIKLQQFSHLVDKKSLYTIGAILVLFALILSVELFVATSKRDAIVAEKEKLNAKYKLQATSFQNRATHKKYTQIHQTQTKLRAAIGTFLSLRLKPMQKVTLIEYKNRLLHVTIKGVNEQNKRALIAQLDSKKLKYRSSFSKDSIKVEVKL